MKNKLYGIVSILMMLSVKLSAGSGEFAVQVYNKPSSISISYTLTQRAQTYSYLLNSLGQVVYNPVPFTDSGTNIQSIFYDAPDDAGVVTIPWGLYDITLVASDADETRVFNFTIDLRDREWARGGEGRYYNGGSAPDTFLEFSFFTLTGGIISYTWGISGNGINKIYDSGQFNDPSHPEDSYLSYGRSENIWTLYEPGSSANQDEFKQPVQLFNKVENTAHSFGALNGGLYGLVNSGDFGLFQHGTNQNLSSANTETQYNSKRNYTFKWEHNLPDVSTNNYDATLTFQLPNTFDNTRQSTRTFRPVYQLTVKNLLEGTPTSGGTVWFKDPVTNSINGVLPTNFVSKSAAGNGYINQEAFENLDEEINGIASQKYALKAVSSFTDGNGIKWQWQSGDFNPTTATDLLLTGNTTKTANYKGILTSNTSGWVQSGMENFNGTEAVLYPSMNELWLHIEEIS